MSNIKYEECKKEEWNELMKAIHSGQIIKIDESIYWYFLEVLPPLYSKQTGFLLLEPYSHDSDGHALRSWFYGTPEKGFYSQLVNEKYHLNKQQMRC